MKLLAFAASNSSQSINKRLVSYAAQLVPNSITEVLDLNDYELPLFSEDREKALGQPQIAHDFLMKIAECDALMISFAEHNGSMTAAYKNLFDWCSRINNKVYQDKPMVLLATSPGGRGGKGALEKALIEVPRFAGKVVGHFSLPSFYDQFDSEKNEIKDPAMQQKLVDVVLKLVQ